METLLPHSFNTQLADRVLWYDGDNEMDIDQVTEMLLSGQPVPKGTCVEEVTSDIKQFNSFVSSDQQIKTKSECRLPFNLEWQLPTEYSTLNIEKYIADKLTALELSPNEIAVRVDRICDELSLYEQHDLEPFLKCLVYVINTLLSRNIPWGVGRGSSVSSYILYLIGVHDVDSVKYELDITDFLQPVHN